jgi:signal peptidase II
MKFRIALFIIFAVFLADQLSKWWVLEQLIKPLILPERSDSSALPFIPWLFAVQAQMPFARIEVFPFFNIVMAWNKGMSFGLFNSHGIAGTIALSAIALTIITAFGIWLYRSKSALLSLGLSLIIGGALGNLCDRARFGAVADFLDFHAFGLHFWAFNIGDSGICVGIALLLIHSLFFDPKIKQAASQ